MALSSDLLSQFAKITNDNKKTIEETTVYGTAVEYNGGTYVRLDGSELLTPITTTATVKAGERVTVLIKNHTATVTGNLSSPSARINDVNKIAGDVVEFNTVLANKVDTLEFNAERARINTLVVDNATIKNKLAANEAEITNIQTVNINVTGKITAVEADINVLRASKLDANVANITYAKITDLEATNATIGTLDANLAKIDTLMFGAASGNVIQTSFSNTVIAHLGDAQIKSAMIESIAAGKITAGDIITNNVRVMSEDGALVISDETIQIRDSRRVRVQIGKDAVDDYSINIWDQEGNLMFSEGGITDSAIKTSIIRDDMVSDTANISAHKLDIDSLFEEINGSTNTIKSTKVYFDDESQTLDIVFKTLESDVDGLSDNILSQGTAISIIQGHIDSKIWQQDIDSATGELSTQYSTLEQELTGFKTTVSETKSTMTELGVKMESAESSISQLSNSINSNVIETTELGTRMTSVEQTASGLTARLDEQIVGGTNILRGTNDVSSLGSSSSWANSTWRSAGGGTGTRTVISVTDAPNANIKKGFKIVGDDTDTTTAQDNIPIVAGTTYTMSCYARGTGTLRLQVGKSPYTSKTFVFDGETVWTKCSYTFVAGKDNGIADGKTNVYFGNRGTGSMELCGFKMEYGNVATDWTMSPYDVVDGITSASRTATDYLNFSSAGLVVGDMTAGTLGNNVLIDSDSVDIRKGSTTMASFGANYLYLAKNSRNAKIDLCNGLATMYHESKYSYDTLFVIDTGNSTEIMGLINPLCITSVDDLDKVSIQFANSKGVMGGVGIVGNWLRRFGSNMYDSYTILDSGNFHDVMDSGWIYGGVIGENFSLYSNDYQIQYRKIGKIVEVRGVVKPVTTIPGSTDNHTIFTLAEGYRPSEYIYERCQGSGVYTWLLSITTSGVVRFARYGDGAKYVDVDAGAWLPFHITFFVD